MRVRDESFSEFDEKILSNRLKNDDKGFHNGIIQYSLNEKDELIFSGFNKYCNKILGVDCEQYVGKTITEAFPALAGTDVIDQYRKVAISGEPWSNEKIEYEDNQISGAYRVNAQQLENRKIMVSFQDVTETKKSEKLTLDQLKFLDKIYSNVHHLIFVVKVAEDDNFIFEDVNPYFEEISEMDRDSIIGKSIYDFSEYLSDESIKNIISNYNRCKQQNDSCTYEELLTIEGKERWWLTTLNPIQNKNGTVDKIIGTSIEITERKNVEQQLIEHENNLESIVEERTSELQESESRFRKMAEGLYEGIRIYEAGKLVYVNDAFCTISGYSAKELKNRSSIELVHPNHKQKVLDHIEMSKASKETPNELIFDLVSKSGDIKKIKNRYISREKDNGELALYIISNDITENEKNLEQLALQSKALNAAANGISISDENGEIIWVNDAFTNLTGYEREELLGQNPKILKSGKHTKEYYSEMWSTINNGSAWRGEFINKKKNGDLYHDETTITPLTKNEKIVNFIEIKQDVTDRKINESNLRKREEHYRSLFENSHNAIFVSDFSGNILELNNSAKELFGLNGDSISNLNSFKFIENENKLNEFLLQLKENGFVKDFSSKIIKQNKTKIDCLINATLLKSESGEADVFQAILIDISDVIKAKRILEDALKEAEKANKLKSEFLATMSHEIRTPINIILSYLGLIKSDIIDQVDEDLQGLFPSMEKAGKRIIRTIDLLLNVAELNTGTYEGKFEVVDLYERILERVYLDYRKEASSKGLEFKLIKLCDESDIRIDEYTVNEIMNNLIDNAIKYTEKGKVVIKLRKNILNKLEIEVADTGIGIDQSYLPDLFEPFTQEEMGYSRKFEGNGLGMALVKQYAKLNNAEINVASSKGVGTNFIITFNH